MKRIIFFGFLFALSPLAAASPMDDDSALRVLDAVYAARWIDADADGVMKLFTEDATIVPHHGDTPIVGKAAIRKFWFNPDYPPTVVTEWSREPAEVLVLGDAGIVRGRARLIWEFDGVRTTIPEMNYVLIAERRDGDWRIRMLTWNDDPRTWIREDLD